MRYSSILKDDVINGKGVGVCLYTQGCPFHCKGCFNPETWDFEGGNLFTNKNYDELISAIEKPYITRFTLLGGEPLVDGNYEPIKNLIDEIKSIKPYIQIWVYTGNTFEQLKETKWRNVLDKIDILIDGQFIEEEKDLTLKFRGSRNQRIIDIQKTLKEGEVILYLI